MPEPSDRALGAALLLQSAAILLFELLLTRLFAVTLFADFAHLALALALLGISTGAMAQHLFPSLVPREGLGERVSRLGLLQGVLILIAVIAAIRFPVLTASETPPETYQDRSFIKDDLLNPYWFAALLPILGSPFAIAGLTFAGVFSRRKAAVGGLYAADLLGAAAAAVVFVPLLRVFAGPDLCFVAIAACGAAALVLERRRAVSAVYTAVAVLVTLIAASRDVLPIRTAAGYSEDRLVYTEWTPVTRLAIHRDRRGDYMLLDNSSASEIVQTAARRDRLALEATRALVYRLHDPPAKIAIIAASAGPEVAAAQSLGFTGIDAIDIAGDIFRLVGDRYPDAPVNPYRIGDTRRLDLDGRAAILRASEPYDVIQMVHANLWSSAGLMSNAWSPALLETREAFGTYLDHLTEDGTISFGRGSDTPDLVRAAAAALRDRGVGDPRRHIVYLGGNSSLMLLKRHPWTAAEHDRLMAALADFPKSKVLSDPTDADASRAWTEMMDGRPPMTDDHPYADTPAIVGATLKRAFDTVKGEDAHPVAALYRSIVIQVVFVLVAGLLFVGAPLAVRRSELANTAGSGWALAYTACLGYGYLSVETVLIHDLVLFVGHPTYAVTAVVLAMLASSGLGSAWASRRSATIPVLRGTLLATVALGAVLAVAVIPGLYATLLWLPLLARAAIVIVTLAPLGFVMGTAFPLGIQAMPPGGAAVIPWAWAINGWMSVLGSLSTVLVARLWGYTAAFAVALLAYLVAVAVAGRLSRVGAGPASTP